MQSSNFKIYIGDYNQKQLIFDTYVNLIEEGQEIYIKQAKT